MNPYLLPAIEMGPRSIGRIIALIPPARYDERPDPNRFTVREAVAHLADWEPFGRDRLMRGVNESGCTVENFDEDERVVSRNYAGTDPVEQARVYAAERRKTAEYLRSLRPEDLSNSFTHPEKGVMSVEDQANLFLGHDLYHVEHLTQFIGEKSAGTW